jgi:hypothetical protein
MQGRKLAYKKTKDLKHTKEKATHKTLYVQMYGKKKIILLQKHSPGWSIKGQNLKYLPKKNK